MAKLESLIVDLQVNSAALKEGLEAANKKLDAFDKNLKDLAGVVVFEKFAKQAFSAASSLVNFAMAGAEATDHMGKLAASTGMSVESFSRLAYAGDLSGVSADALAGALVKLDSNMSKAATGGKEQAAVFQALGIKVTDSAGKMRGADAVMGDLAERFAGMEDGASKTKLAVDVFGKAGADMIPMLNAGREGLAALGAEADKFGITVTGSAAAAAEAFNDNLAKLKMAATAVGQRVAAQLAPALTTLTDELVNSADGAEFLKDAAWILSGVLKTLVSAGVIITAVFESVGKTLARVASALVNLAGGNFQAAADDMKGVLSDIGDAGDKAGKRLAGIWKDSAEPAKALRQTHGKTADAVVKDAADMVKAATEAENAFKALEKVALGFEAQVEGFGGTALDELKGKLEKGELADQLKKLGDGAAAMRDRILEAAEALQALKDAKLADDLSFNMKRSGADFAAQTGDRRTRFAQAGATPSPGAYAQSLQGAKNSTAGFSDFEAALKRLATKTDEAAKLAADAEMYKAKGMTDLAQETLLASDVAKRSATKAAQAADAFTDLAASLVDARKKSIADAAGAESWGEAMKILQADFKASLQGMPDFGAELEVWFKRMSGQLGKAGQQMLGAVGDLVDSVIQGAQAGGIWGAIIAAFMEIAKRTASALAFLDTAMQFVEKIATMVEPLVKPIFAALQGVLEIVADVIAPVFKALQPFFYAIAALVKDLSPVIWAVGDLFASLSPIIEFIGNVIGKLFEFLKPLFDIIGGVIKAIATVVLGVLIALNEIAAAFGDEKAAKEAKRMRALVDSMWKDADKTKSSFNARPDTTTNGPVTATGAVTATGPIDMKAFDIAKYVGGGKPVDVIDIGGWGYAAGSVAGAEAARGFVESAALINGATVEAAQAAGQAAYDDFLALGDAADGAAKSLATFSNQLTNVPAGFRYAAEAFNATGVDGARDVFTGGQQGSLTVIVEGSVLSELDLVSIIEQHQRRSGHRKTGTGAKMTDNYR